MHFPGVPPVRGSTGPGDPVQNHAIAVAGSVVLLVLSVVRHFHFRALTQAERNRLLERRRRVAELGGRARRVRLVGRKSFNRRERMSVVDEESTRYLLDANQKIEGRLPKDPSQPFWLLGMPEVEEQEPNAYRGHGSVKISVLRAIDGVYLVGTGDTPPVLEVALPRMPRYLPIYPILPLAICWLWSRSLGNAGQAAFGYLVFMAFVLVEPAAWAFVKNWYPELPKKRSDSPEKRV